jgi:hypothetical protein
LDSDEQMRLESSSDDDSGGSSSNPQSQLARREQAGTGVLTITRLGGSNLRIDSNFSALVAQSIAFGLHCFARDLVIQFSRITAKRWVFRKFRDRRQNCESRRADIRARNGRSGVHVNRYPIIPAYKLL